MSVKGWATAEDFNEEEVLAGYEDDLAGGAAFWKPQSGESEIRIVGVAGERPYRKRAQHWVRGTVDRPFNCPRCEDPNAPCFLCDKSKELKASDSEEDQERGDDLYAKTQYLYRIIDIDRPKKGVQVYGAVKSVHKQIAKLLADKRGDYGFSILDPKDGLSLILEKTGSGRNSTEYDVRPRTKRTNVLDILEGCEPPDLDSYCKPATKAEMRKAWEGDDSEEEKAAPTSRRRDVSDDEPKASRRRDEEPEDPDDGEDPPAPAKAASSRNGRKSDEDPDDKPARPGRRLGSRSRDDD